MIENRTHITEEELKQFHNNHLSIEETTELLQHIAQCTYCAEQFAESFETQTIHAPANLKEDILLKAERKTQFQKPMQKISAQKQFFLYSTKVCVAMCGALVLLFTISFQNKPSIQLSNNMAFPPVNEQTYTQKESYMSSINSSLNQFTVLINGHINSIIFGADTDESNQLTNSDKN